MNLEKSNSFFGKVEKAASDTFNNVSSTMFSTASSIFWTLTKGAGKVVINAPIIPTPR